mmetsp:Transcript_35310/g.51898  ORF Transcript_35310/g.51898 Transcript_35310/m.51898 type:complete len:245 (+) Transcript_35310:91-825(+)
MLCSCGKHDGDQLCSNFAIVFGVFALILGILTQATCSFVSIVPGDITYIAFNSTTTLLTTAERNRSLSSIAAKTFNVVDAFEKEFMEWLTSGNDQLVAKIGPWKIGINSIVQCNSYTNIGMPATDPLLQATQAMGILASLFGGCALILACFGCVQIRSRRKLWNKMIGVLYFLAFVSTAFTMLIFNMDVCKNISHTFVDVALNGTKYDEVHVKYNGCGCREGCVVTIIAACFWLVSGITVLVTV